MNIDDDEDLDDEDLDDEDLDAMMEATRNQYKGDYRGAAAIHAELAWQAEKFHEDVEENIMVTGLDDPGSHIPNRGILDMPQWDVWDVHRRARALWAAIISWDRWHHINANAPPEFLKAEHAVRRIAHIFTLLIRRWGWRSIIFEPPPREDPYEPHAEITGWESVALSELRSLCIACDELRSIIGHNGPDVRLISWMSGWGQTSGENLVIAGLDKNGLLHIRTFDVTGVRTDTFETMEGGELHLVSVDASGDVLSDTLESSLPAAQSSAIAALKQQLPGLMFPSILSSAERDQVLSEVTSIFGLTRHNHDPWFMDRPTATEPGASEGQPSATTDDLPAARPPNGPCPPPSAAVDRQSERSEPTAGRADGRQSAGDQSTDTSTGAKREKRSKPKRYKPGEPALKIRALLEALAEEGQWDVEEKEIIRQARVPKSTYYHVLNNDPTVMRIHELYQKQRLGRGPARADDL